MDSMTHFRCVALSRLYMRSRVLQEGLVYWQTQNYDAYHDCLSLMRTRTVPL